MAVAVIANQPERYGLEPVNYREADRFRVIKVEGGTGSLKWRGARECQYRFYATITRPACTIAFRPARATSCGSRFRRAPTLATLAPR